jgi:hypothetical protein
MKRLAVVISAGVVALAATALTVPAWADDAPDPCGGLNVIGTQGTVNDFADIVFPSREGFSVPDGSHVACLTNPHNVDFVVMLQRREQEPNVYVTEAEVRGTGDLVLTFDGPADDYRYRVIMPDDGEGASQGSYRLRAAFNQ